MKLVVPEYFHSFKCIAGDCRDSCCVGWEIDIDAKTLEKFDTVPGMDGKMLRESVDRSSDVPCFHTVCGRCVHLRRDGLCELICRWGDGMLCDICREHPRYYTTLGDVTYGGLGMTCEAACELILTERGDHSYSVTNGYDAEYEECDGELADRIMQLHGELARLLCERERPLVDRLAGVISRTTRLAEAIDERDYSLMLYGSAQYGGNASGTEPTAETVRPLSRCGSGFTDLLDLLSELEYMSDVLPTLYGEIKTASDGERVANFGDFDSYLTNVALYFLDRYFPVAAADGDLLGTLALTLTSVFVLSHAFSRTDGALTSLVDAAKCWSSEIEYCEENVDAIRASAEEILPTLITLILNAK